MSSVEYIPKQRPTYHDMQFISKRIDRHPSKKHCHDLANAIMMATVLFAREHEKNAMVLYFIDWDLLSHNTINLIINHACETGDLELFKIFEINLDDYIAAHINDWHTLGNKKCNFVFSVFKYGGNIELCEHIVGRYANCMSSDTLCMINECEFA